MSNADLTVDEILGLLGYHDLPHSFQWYRDRYPEAPEGIKAFIVQQLLTDGYFPPGAGLLDERTRRMELGETIEPREAGYAVCVNSERGYTIEELHCGDAESAAERLIQISGSSSGSIGSYWTL